MKKVLLVGFVLIVLFACSKNKFQTKPQISVKSVSTRVVPINGDLTITLSYTDKEGDISDSLFFIKKRLNKRFAATISGRDTIGYPIPDFPNYDKGEIGMALRYQDHLISAQSPNTIPGSNPVQYEPDSLDFKIWIIDKAKNVSDTVSTGLITILRTN